MLIILFASPQPLSEKTKQYILNLDIEKDARLLHERLNICSEALDYFCASSSILKAGVKAGLTLYDIAVMCCRNDNMGEIPSKLEVLFSMAAELAESAIENGRWHHAAASQALEEQLSPIGGSLLSPGPRATIQKSASAIALPQYSEGLASLASANKRETPGMVQSSASDSSSDTGDLDREDCEEWAASLIMDVSLDKSFSLMPPAPKKRSSSIESEGSTESEEGFWYVRPGSDQGDSSDEDDESISWDDSPSTPKNVLNMSASSFADQSRKAFNPFDGSRPFSYSVAELPDEDVVDPRVSYNPFQASRRSSLILAEMPGDESSSMYKQFRSPGKVSFAVPSHDDEDLPRDARFKHSNSDVGEPKKLFMKRPESGMKRSQSYSAFSSTNSEKVAVEDDNPITRPVDHEQYRDYFLKFVDLVIVRETTAAARFSKQDL